MSEIAEEGMQARELHLTDNFVRQAVIGRLQELGYKFDVRLLKIYLYGYGDQSDVKLTEFQGHVDFRSDLSLVEETE